MSKDIYVDIHIRTPEGDLSAHSLRTTKHVARDVGGLRQAIFEEHPNATDYAIFEIPKEVMRERWREERDEALIQLAKGAIYWMQLQSNREELREEI